MVQYLQPIDTLLRDRKTRLIPNGVLTDGETMMLQWEGSSMLTH
ncbi:hypothetical protein [Chryseobacterium indologenes]